MPSVSFLEMRRRNALSILQAVRANLELSRADVARQTKLAKATVSSVVDELIDLGIIQETGTKTSHNGRRPIGLSFNPSARCEAGVSITTNRFEIVLCDLNGRRCGHLTAERHDETDAMSLTVQISEKLSSLLKDNGVTPKRLGACGLAVPGPVPSSPNSIASRNPIDYRSIRHQLEKMLHRPVVIDSNTNMAAIAEIHTGAIQGVEWAVVVRLGDQVRSALIHDRVLLSGTNGLAGELGHIQAPGQRRVCACGKLGCINAVAGSRALIETARAVAGRHVKDVPQLVKLAKGDQRELKAAIKEAAQSVGYGVATVINLLAPGQIILCGKLLEAEELFMSPFRQSVEKHATKLNLLNCQIINSHFDEQPEAFGAALAARLHDELIPKVTDE